MWPFVKKASKSAKSTDTKQSDAEEDFFEEDEICMYEEEEDEG